MQHTKTQKHVVRLLEKFIVEVKDLFTVFLLFTLYSCPQVAQLPAEKSDIFIQYLQDNIPPGVSLHMELVRKPNSLEFLLYLK